MKRVRINTGKIGLVFKNRDYKRVIAEGVYWLNFSEEVLIYDMASEFYPSVDLNILLKDTELKEYLIVQEVKDNEIVLKYENGNFRKVLKSGRYAFWKGLVEYKFVKADLSKYEITEDIDKTILKSFALSEFVRIVSLEPKQKALLYVNGKFVKVLDENIYYFWKNPDIIHVTKVDLRQLQMEISGQEILTKDKAALRVNFYLQYKINDIEKAFNETKDYEKQLYVLVQLALREFIGMLSLDEILDNKNAVSEYVYKTLAEKVKAIGIKIIGSGVKDIILPGEVKEIMNQVLVAQKRAQANIITRREETASTRSLLNTAKLMEENDMLFKLKEMEYVEKIADKINSISLSGGSGVAKQLKEIFSTSN